MKEGQFLIDIFCNRRLVDIRGAINLDVEDVNSKIRIGKVSIKLQQFMH